MFVEENKKELASEATVSEPVHHRTKVDAQENTEAGKPSGL
jgi:hypothetical protein